jgi:hypothetical protein
MTDAEALWKWGVVERWAPALGGWLRLREYVSLRPGETAEAVAERLADEPERRLGNAKPILRVVVMMED